MKSLFLVLVVSVGLTGCALPVPGVRKSLLEEVGKGDSRRDVERVFGHPHYRYAKGNTEFLLYSVDEDGDGRADSENRIVLMLVEGRLYDKGLEDRENGGIQTDPEGASEPVSSDE